MAGTMKAINVAEADAPWLLITKPIPKPGPTQVLVKVKACGLCGTDIWITSAKLCSGAFPLSPGHEAVGEVVEIGSEVTTREVGDRVGVCSPQRCLDTCDCCKKVTEMDSLIAEKCPTTSLIGFNTHGGHAQYMLAYEEETVLLPGGLSYENGASIICAGYTVWGGFLSAEPKFGETVAVVGIGGLGHLALQFSKARGFRTIAVSRSASKHELALALGADEVVSNGDGLKAVGGADILLACGNSNKSVIDAMIGMRTAGRVVLMGISFEDIVLTSMPVVMNRLHVIGSAHNDREYLIQALRMTADGKINPMIEVFPMERIQEAVDKMKHRRLKFKAVITYT